MKWLALPNKMKAKAAVDTVIFTWNLCNKVNSRSHVNEIWVWEGKMGWQRWMVDDDVAEWMREETERDKNTMYYDYPQQLYLARIPDPPLSRPQSKL